MIYFIYAVIGVLYVIFNGTVRKIYNDGDWFLPITHFLLWPIYAGTALYLFVFKRDKYF